MAFSRAPYGGPLASAVAFHGWFSWFPKHAWFIKYGGFAGFKKFIHRTCDNIIISRDTTAIIDQHQSGYWGSGKALLTENIDDEWTTKYIPMFLKAHGGYYESYGFSADSLVY